MYYLLLFIIPFIIYYLISVNFIIYNVILFIIIIINHLFEPCFRQVRLQYVRYNSLSVLGYLNKNNVGLLI
jgi:hypothetical protein